MLNYINAISTKTTCDHKHGVDFVMCHVFTFLVHFINYGR